MPSINTLIIGAGPAGLACAGALKMRGIDAVVVEKAGAVGPVWRRHYDRLHLHTPKYHSALPGLPMPQSYPTYPSRDQVVAYLEDYARHHRIAPVFGAEVRKVTHTGTCWQVETRDTAYLARHVIVATGVASFPNRADWPGLAAFAGPVSHSSDYRNPQSFAGQRVLVVGFGNSGGEIALDLAEAGVKTVLSVRGPVNVVPRDVFGIPAQSFAIAERHLPPQLVDLLNGTISRLRMGDISQLGLAPSSKGPTTQIVEDKRIPLIDIGTLGAIRNGSILVRGGIARFDPSAVHFVSGAPLAVDAVILATGYKPDLRAMLPALTDDLDQNGSPKASGQACGRSGLWFCGYSVVPTGHLREIRLEALAIADAIETA